MHSNMLLSETRLLCFIDKPGQVLEKKKKAMTGIDQVWIHSLQNRPI